MDWNDEGIVLTARPHGETGLVVSLLTRDHGRHSGFVPGGVSRRARPVWQSGNLVEIGWVITSAWLSHLEATSTPATSEEMQRGAEMVILILKPYMRGDNA